MFARGLPVELQASHSMWQCAASVLHPAGRFVAGAIPASVAATRPMSVLRFDARIWRGHRIRPGPRGALPLLLALRHRLESRARRLHHLRPVAFRGTAGNRGQSGRGQSRDAQRLPHLCEDALPGPRHGGGPVSRTTLRRWAWIFWLPKHAFEQCAHRGIMPIAQ